jgi:hypothetical protein
MTGSDDVLALAEAVNEAKSAQGGSTGGAFLIDEYGRVLVPGGNGTNDDVFVAGECSGPLRFHNAFDGNDFDLYADMDLQIGDAWNRPYIGVRYQLSKADELYFWDVGPAGSQKLTPPQQDASLVRALRLIRPYGPVRFLLGPGGVAITKAPPLWEPHYAGRLDLTTWFPKEALE